MVIYPCCLIGHAPLAQLDRASGYGPEGQEFESLAACQKSEPFGFGFFCFLHLIRGVDFDGRKWYNKKNNQGGYHHGK